MSPAVSSSLPEADWRHFKHLYPSLQERFCRRVLTEAAGLLAASDTTAPEQYLRLSRLVQEQDEQFDLLFGDPSPTTVLDQLKRLRETGLLEDSELAGFTARTRHTVGSLAGPPGSRSASRRDNPASRAR